jgi:hypothetical protein
MLGYLFTRGGVHAHAYHYSCSCPAATEIDLDGPVEGYAAFGTSVTS